MPPSLVGHPHLAGRGRDRARIPDPLKQPCLAGADARAGLENDAPPDLAGIRARVLLIRGRYDRMVPFEVSIAILNHIADSRLVLLNNCGHWPPCWSAAISVYYRTN